MRGLDRDDIAVAASIVPPPTHRLCAIDLFAGAGGLSMGLARAGIATVCAVENDPHAVETFRGHSPAAKILDRDIERTDLRAYRGEVDLICGGPPCQPFSSGGLRGAADDERDMVPRFIEAVELIRPRAFLMENVPGLGAGSRAPYLALVLDTFRALGYLVSWAELNAADFGVPQSRRRLFIVGMRDRHFVFPPATHGPGRPDPQVAVADVLPPHQIGEPNPAAVVYAKKPDLRPNPYHGLLFNGGGRPINRALPAPTILASAGGNKTHFFDDLNLVPEYHRHLLRGGHPREGILPGARRLTVAESAVLQSFPPGMVFHGPPSAQYEQVGNAVPPVLAAVLGHALVAQLSAGTRRVGPVFAVSRPTQPALFAIDRGMSMVERGRNRAVERAVEHALDRIDAFIGQERPTLPNPQHRRACDDLLRGQAASVRTCALFLAFYRIAEPTWDLHSVPVGIRGKYGDKRLSQELSERYITLHDNIVAWAENLGIKGNASRFAFDTDPRFASFLAATRDADAVEQGRIADYLALRFAESQRIPSALPPVDDTVLTFFRAKALFHRLLALPSSGHIPQFLIAALLNELRKKQRIEVVTHHPHASDRFDAHAGDIEEFQDSRLIRAYEVTMRDDWKNRLSGFRQKMDVYGLRKYLIIAAGVNNDTDLGESAPVALSLVAEGRDIAVIDIRDVVNFLAAELDPGELRAAVNKGYEYLADRRLSGREDYMELYREAVDRWLDQTVQG
jgi:DNA (cytosine-5)-methyltransferase 1